MQVELKHRGLGELLGLTFSLTAAHFGRLLAIVAPLELPTLAYEVLRHQHRGLPRGAPRTFHLALFAGWLLLAVLLRPLQQGAAILLLSSSFTGRDPSLGDSL